MVLNMDDVQDLYDLNGRLSKLDPWSLIEYLEEAKYYSQSNITMRKKFIQDEMKHLWKDEKICVSSSKKYIKQMKREIRMFEDRESLFSNLIDKIKKGEFSKKGDE